MTTEELAKESLSIIRKGTANRAIWNKKEWEKKLESLFLSVMEKK